MRYRGPNFLRNKVGGNRKTDGLRRLRTESSGTRNMAGVAVRSEGWWTRSQSIRTEGEVPFEAALAELSKAPVYQAIAEQAAHLHLLGMNPKRIAVPPGADRTTVTRALRWVRSHYLGM